MTNNFNLEYIVSLLDYWLDKVEDCYYGEVKASMERFKKECGIVK